MSRVEGILTSTGRAYLPQPLRNRLRPARPCPCCNLPGGFCESHRARLAEIRVELGNEIKILGQYARRRDQRRKKLPPTCNASDCWEPRIPPRAFCDACAAAGWVEEE